MSAITTYADGNMIEDVMLEVTTLSPEDRPFMEGISKKKAIQTTHQWPIDHLNARASLATIENASISAGTSLAPIRKLNYTEYMTTAWQVSNTDIAVQGAGVDDMFMYQRSKKLKELANGVEYDLINSTASAGLTTAARTMTGMIASITSNLSNATGMTVTETMFVNLFSLAWISGGNPRKVFVNSTMKKAITNFTANVVRQVSADKATQFNSVDFYVNDFTNKAEIVLSHDIPTGTCNCDIAVIDDSLYSAAYLIPIRDVQCGQVTYGKLGAVEWEVTLENRGEGGSALLYNANA